MERHSARLDSIPRTNFAENVDDEDGNGPFAAIVLRTVKAKTKKRKATELPASSSSSAAPVAKRARGKRGMLKDLVEMPMDILFEIFGQLEPLDLLNLSRTTKALRSILMKRSSISLWKQSFSHFEALPQCPDDISEPQYADLAFGKNCYFCQRNLASTHTLWSARIRTCTRCVDEEFLLRGYPYWTGYNRKYPVDVAVLIPTLEITKSTGRYRNRSKSYVYTRLDQLWEEQYTNLKSNDEKAIWTLTKVAEQNRINEHAKLCVKWASERQEHREIEKASTLNERKAIVEKKIRQMGWGDELDKIPSGVTKPQDDPVVVKACQKELTDRILLNLEDHLSGLMEAAKVARIARERSQFLKQRLHALRDTYIDYLKTLPAGRFYPNTAQIFLDQTVKDIINDSSTSELTQEQVGQLLEVIPGVLERWTIPVRQRLLEIIENSVESNFVFDPETILDAATTQFQCNNCLDYLTTERAMRHKCMFDLTWTDKIDDNDIKLARIALYQTPWNISGDLSFKQENVAKMSKALEICGFDPQAITAADLDLVDPVIECITCNDTCSGRCTFRWTSLLHHLNQYNSLHKLPGADLRWKFYVLVDQEAQAVRARLLEEQQRSNALNSTEHICTRCRDSGSWQAMLLHGSNEHGIIEPKYGDDFVVSPSSRTLFAPHRLWPPRSQAIVDSWGIFVQGN